MSQLRRIAIVLPGLHRVNRGAETAFESVGRELARVPGWSVTLFGSGQTRPDEPYQFVQVPCTPRERFERWPKLPVFRSDTAWEEWSFVRQLRKIYDPGAFDATMTCGYPFCNWLLRRTRDQDARRPAHVFVTQNGDWPCRRKSSEYLWFGCDALVCTNPAIYDRNRHAYRSWLIPNGVDAARFDPERVTAAPFSSSGRIRVLMVSALIPSKRVREAVDMLSTDDDIELCLAGSGPLQAEIDSLATTRMSGRYHRVTRRPAEMPALYAGSDVVLHMSLDESFGNVFVEAMAMGKPVVAHAAPNHRWVLGNSGFMVDTDSREAVLQAIHSAARATGAVDARRIAIDRFDWPVVGGQYAQMLRDLVENRRDPAAVAESPRRCRQ